MFDPSVIRGKFPALNQTVDGRTPVFLDGPGGTQVPQSVMDAISCYFGRCNSNLVKSPFFGVQETHRVVRDAREHASAFVNAHGPDEIVFGANMSTITAHFSRSIAREWKEGDEIIVTDLDHSANVSYWKMAAADRGVKMHVAKLNPDECTIDYDYFQKLISKKTKLVAFGLASNVVGTRSNPKKIIAMAKSVGALTFVDSVHAAPHFLPDVKELDCDFLVCSGYKFFGPHLGFLYGKKEHLERLTAYKVEPASNSPPDKWETGTKSFEALAGFNASIEYLASLGKGGLTLREKLLSSYKDVAEYECHWAREFLSKAKGVKGLKIHGITDPARVHERTATFAMTMDGMTPQQLSDQLARQHIAAGAGNFYAVGVTDTLGLTDKGGVVRAGCVHYNTLAEIERLLEVLG